MSTTITRKKKTTDKKKPVVKISSNSNYPIAKQFRDRVEAGKMTPDEAIKTLKDGGMPFDFLRKMFYMYDSDLLGMKTKPTKKSIKRTAKYSPKSSIPSDKRIRNPKLKVKLYKGGSPKKYGIVDNLKKKRK
tara:strand:+ start:1123 stop:1518 length:396 start_codon:yes stop_codon:yes gene_type:complete